MKICSIDLQYKKIKSQYKKAYPISIRIVRSQFSVNKIDNYFP